MDQAEIGVRDIFFDDEIIMAFLFAGRNEEDASDDSDDDNHGVVPRPHRRAYVDVEGWLRLSGAAFSEHFRMKKTTFEKLCIVVGNHMTRKNRIKRIRTRFDLILLMVVWVLANGDTFRSTGAHFSKKRSVPHYHYTYIIEALNELGPKYIKWPNAVERDVIKVYLEDKYGYPGTVGCIAGVDIDVTAPLEQPQGHVNRHHGYAVKAQAVCDHKLLYRDIYVGEPGSVGDARQFARSPLSTNLRRPGALHPDEHLLGDQAYPLSNHILIPYMNDDRLTPQQRHHNHVLSSCRVSVERSFATWKNKWRRLKLFQVYSRKYCIEHITACFVLHNFVILDGEECMGISFEPHDDVPEPDARTLALEWEAGVHKREQIARFLMGGNGNAG